MNYIGISSSAISSLCAIALTIHTRQDDWSMSLNQTIWGVRDISKWGKAIQPFD